MKSKQSVSFALWRRLVVWSVALVGLLGSGCAKFDAPPTATLPGAVDGVLPDINAPIVVRFSEPVVADSLAIKVIAYETGVEGELRDEDDDDETELSISFSRDGDGSEQGGTGTLSGDRMEFSIALDNPLTVGAKWAVIVEPGLSDDSGNRWRVRQHLVFGYELTCVEGQGVGGFPSGNYFWLVQVESPIPTQIQLWSVLEVDETTGKVTGQFTNADRNLGIDCSDYGLSCKASEVCRTLPEPACVAPSERAGSVEEFVDYGVAPDPPMGYSFLAFGCLQPQPDGSVAFANSPADINVTQPPVDVLGAKFNASFVKDDDGIWQGSGTFTAADVLLGGNSSGPGVGTHVERLVSDELSPSNIPAPAPSEEME